jgi:ABC-type multidrug transport system fused ATPase/permease subunit
MARPNYNSNGNTKEELPKVKLTRESLKEGLWIFEFIKPYRRSFILGLVLISLSGITTMAFPYLLKELISSADLTSKNQVPYFSPGEIALIMIGVLLIQMVFSFFRVYLFSEVGEKAVADLRKTIYKHIISMPMEFFAQNRVGELSSRLSADVSQIQDTVSTVLAELLRGIVVMLIGIVLIIYSSPALTLLILSVVPVIVLVAVVFSRKIRKKSKEAQDQLAESGTIVQESLQGISNVKAFTNEWYEVNRYNQNIQKVVILALKNAQLRGMFVSTLIFSLFATVVAVVWYGSKEMKFEELSAFVIYTAFVGGTMAGFAELYSQLQKSLGATQRIKEMLKENTEIIPLTDEPLNPDYKIYGNVRFESVEFSYPSRPEMQILNGVSLEVKQGQQLAIVGTSGAGKSTLTSLLLGFYQAQHGSLYFDLLNSKEIPVSQLRKQIAFVPQDIFLFGGSILENIAYGNPNANFMEIQNAAKKAYAHDFINSFPEGYDTVVGERGIKLSGGQRQRIAIARAILKNPTLLILDEATSSLDSESEHWVQKALEELMKNRTSIVIAHRLSTIRNADTIVVLDKGKIVESGKHETLMEIENGIYRNLSLMQNQSPAASS